MLLELVVDIDLSTLNVSGQGRMQLLNLILMYTFNPTIPLYHYYDHYTTPLPLVHKLATKYSQKASKRQYGNIHIIQMIIQEKEMVHTASTASITGGGGGGGGKSKFKRHILDYTTGTHVTTAAQTQTKQEER